MNLLSQMPVHFINTVTPPLSTAIIFCANALGTFTILIALFYIAFHRTPRKTPRQITRSLREKTEEMYILVLTGGGAYLSSIVFKNYFGVLRPFVINPDLHSLIYETGYSFPSSHATTFMAIAVSLYFMHKRAGYVFGVGALVIGIARVLVGVHTPLDILGGYLLGFVVAYIITHIFRVKNARNRVE